MKTDDRRNKLETSLPDFLTLVSSNIKAGMTLDQAMWYSAKPEFGLLSTEVKANIKSSFSGESLEDTLDHLAMRFDSKVFKRTILLLKQATATGGELTDVLERTTDDVRNTIIMKKEIAASLVLYEIFVLFAAVVGTPFLFAVALKLIEVFERIAPQAGSIPTTAGGVFTTFSNVQFSGPVISSADFLWFSIPTIFVTSLISSFIVSVIRTGSKSQGMKYFPFVLVLSYLVYWVVVNAIESFFATIG
jgi:archaellum biogenesis protein FlaJ (TadC family)